MDLLTAIVEIIKAVAWPASVFFILRMFREPLSKLAKRIGTLELPGGVKITIASVEEASEEVKQALEDSENKTEPPEESKSLPPTERKELASKEKELRDREDADYQRKLAIEPRFAVNEAWRRLQDVGLKALKFFAKEFEGEETLRFFEELLLEKGILTGTQFQAISKLRRLQAELMLMNPGHVPRKVFNDYVASSLTLAREIEHIMLRGNRERK